MHTHIRGLIKYGFGFVDEPYALFEPTKNHYEPIAVEPDYEKIQNPPKDKIQVTWIGHSSFLVQMGGVNFLTDPHFSKRASPMQWVGPKRVIKPALPINKLPKIDAVLISHDHYDHLDLGTVRALGNKVRYIVPLALADWFKKKKLTNVIDRDWWENTEEAGLTFTCTPAQHFSGRVLGRYNQTLWAAWVVEHKGRKLYFGGDSGYSPHFSEVHQKFGAMDLSLIPIGAYHPRFLMKDMHIDPREAVRAHKDLESKLSVGMHWGTFKLTYEAMNEPPAYLRKVLEQEQIPLRSFVTLPIGATIASD
jgi:L-ascorbate metabolism protein UlaG (beta-lactamase superfamily)